MISYIYVMLHATVDPHIYEPHISECSDYRNKKLMRFTGILECFKSNSFIEIVTFLHIQIRADPMEFG